MRESHRLCTALAASILFGACSSHTGRTDAGSSTPDGRVDGFDGSAGSGGGPKLEGGLSDLVASGAETGLPDASSQAPDAARPDAPIMDGGADALKSKFDGADASKPVPDSASIDSLYLALDGHTRERGSAPPDADPQTNEIIRLCAMAASCADSSSLYSATRCLQEFGKTASRQDDFRLNHLLTCAKSETCAEFQSCWGGTLFTLDPVVTGGVCRGSVLTLSTGGADGPQMDCTAFGGACDSPMTDVPRASCNPSSCVNTGSASCEGASATGCGDGPVYTEVDCARSGRVCQLTPGGPVCTGSGATCDRAQKVTCSGSLATYCSGSALAKVDCAGNGLATRCADGASPSEPCAPAGDECDPATFEDQCEGYTLKLCANGFIVSLECNSVAVDLATCYVPTSSYARCTHGT